MNGPSRREDTRNLTLIAGGGLVGVLGTVALVAAFDGPATAPATHEVVRVHVEARPTFEAPGPEAFEAADRLYGHVTTRRGDVHTGLLRWDRNEGSWADVLDALKGNRESGIRFGHLRAIEPTGSRSARLTLTSGGVVELTGNATDLGSGLRSLEVQGSGTAPVRLDWNDLERVEFEPAPPGTRTSEARLHGTLHTQSGQSFTGYVAWNVADIYTSDVLDAGSRSDVRSIPFHSLASLQRRDARSAVATLTDGTRLSLRGGSDIGTSNGGITVSDPGLGEVKVGWNQLSLVRFHPPEAGTHQGEFDGGGILRGTVRTEDGSAHPGTVVWDRDEAASWEFLHGSDAGVEFQVEFGKIARIQKSDSGVAVFLRDGRAFHLTGSNDVNGSNGGILVAGEGRITDISWSDFAELRLEPGSP